jgi:hypothetical protein
VEDRFFHRVSPYATFDAPDRDSVYEVRARSQRGFFAVMPNLVKNHATLAHRRRKAIRISGRRFWMKEATRMLRGVSTFAIPAFALFLAAPPARGQERGRPSPDVPAEKFFKNIQVLKGLPSTELLGTMRFMASSLGVRCEHCHVTSKTGHWPMEKDDKEAKKVARKMIVMMRGINQEFFGRHDEVNCASCHNGHLKPEKMPPLLEAARIAPARETPGSSEKLPGTAELLSRYAEALGGRAKYEQVHSRILTGTVTTTDGKTAVLEIDQRAPDKYRLSVKDAEETFTRGYDGREGWNSQGRQSSPMDADELAAVKRQADFFADIDLKSRYQILAVAGPETVAGRPAVKVLGRTTDGGRETLDFDAESGLLVRRTTYQETAFGRIPDETDYEDYRPVEGMMFPFRIVRRGPNFYEVRRFEAVRLNEPLADSIFERPKTEDSTPKS